MNSVLRHWLAALQRNVAIPPGFQTHLLRKDPRSELVVATEVDETDASLLQHVNELDDLDNDLETKQKERSNHEIVVVISQLHLILQLYHSHESLVAFQLEAGHGVLGGLDVVLVPPLVPHVPLGLGAHRDVGRDRVSVHTFLCNKRSAIENQS